jgi:D-alanine transaminase
MTVQESERTFYVNGNFVRESEARISVLDRGFLYGDGVYEVSTVLDGKLIDNKAHLNRLARSLQEVSIKSPVPLTDIPKLQRQVIESNNLVEGVIYLQITRGAADRELGFPRDAEPSLIMFSQARVILNSEAARTGIRLITLEDLRWKRRDIKTINLLAPVLAKQAALSAGANDAWLVEEGFITEGSSNNAFIVTENDTIVTRQLGNEILHGITRKAVLKVAETLGLTIEERAFTLTEALAAREAFITSASTFVTPVIEINGNPIGSGSVGPISRNLRAKYIEYALGSAE